MLILRYLCFLQSFSYNLYICTIYKSNLQLSEILCRLDRVTLFMFITFSGRSVVAFILSIFVVTFPQWVVSMAVLMASWLIGSSAMSSGVFSETSLQSPPSSPSFSRPLTPKSKHHKHLNNGLTDKFLLPNFWKDPTKIIQSTLMSLLHFRYTRTNQHYAL